jgi:hypothetical protein
MRYFFHTLENGKGIQDEDGFEFANDDAAKTEAAQFLANIAADVIPDDGDRSFAVEVTDESGAVIAAIGFDLHEGLNAGA